MRFPFDKYKTENWDIEHVSSQTERKIIGEKKMREWVNDMLDYFIGSSQEEAVSSFINEKPDDKDKVKDFCINLFSLKKESKRDESSFSELFAINLVAQAKTRKPCKVYFLCISS